MSETLLGLPLLTVIGMASIGLIVVLFRILANRLFLNLSAIPALCFVAFLAFLIGWGR